MSGIDLDRLAAGCASISWHPWRAFPGAIVGVRALTSVEWADAMRAARERVPESVRGPARQVAVRHEESIETVVRCTSMRDDTGALVSMLTHDDARELDAEALFELVTLAVHEQDAAHGADVIPDDLKKAVESDPRHNLERARAVHAAGLHGYYGEPARMLTDWQVLIFLHLVRRDDA